MASRLMLKGLWGSRRSTSLLAPLLIRDNHLPIHNHLWSGRRQWRRFLITSLKHQVVRITRRSIGNLNTGLSGNRRCHNCKHKRPLPACQTRVSDPLTSRWLARLLRTTRINRRLGLSVCRKTVRTGSRVARHGRSSRKTHNLNNNTEVRLLLHEALYAIPSLLPSDNKTSTAP